MTLSPKVSIVIPVYNGADYLAEAIDSALAQTYENIEVMVVDDGSDDGGKTEGIARTYGDRIRYFRKDNGGVASALNLGIREMTGEYFSWLSHDDQYYPNKIETQLRFLQAVTKNAVLYGDYDVINSESKLLWRVSNSSIPPERFRYNLIITHRINGCTVLVPKKVFDVCGLFNEELLATQDYDMWFRAAESFPFIHVPQALIMSREHSKQGIHEMKVVYRRECNELLIRLLKDMPESELVSHTGKPPGFSFAEIAVNLTYRNFIPAAGFSARMATKQLLRQRFGYAVMTGVCLASTPLIRFVINPLKNRIVYPITHRSRVLRDGTQIIKKALIKSYKVMR